jgi:hypothetical protein
MSAASIDSLPYEMLSHIFSHLDSPAPSTFKLRDQPTATILQSASVSGNLKAISSVCQKWRKAVFPILFQNVIWRLDTLKLPTFQDRGEIEKDIEIIRFLQANDLCRYVTRITLIVDDSIDLLCTRTASNIGLTETGQEQHAIFDKDINCLWRSLFHFLDPSRFTIIASPAILAALLSRMICLEDSWSFSMPYHILSLSYDKPAVVTKSTFEEPVDGELPQTPATESKQPLSELFTIRPWHSILLNEGSFTKAYKTYEYYHKRPPSILGALLGAENSPNDGLMLPPTIKDMEYVGIFPLSTHVNLLAENLPRLDRLFVQLVPQNDILNDREEMKHIDANDLWMERNSAYSVLMRGIFDPPSEGAWATLRVFESGDAADKEAWDLAVQYIQHNPRSGWKAEKDGVFVRLPSQESSGGFAQSVINRPIRPIPF